MPEHASDRHKLICTGQAQASLVCVLLMYTDFVLSRAD